MPFPQVLTFSGDAKTIRLVGHRDARGLLPLVDPTDVSFLVRDLLSRLCS